jgi:hypothetical protein
MIKKTWEFRLPVVLPAHQEALLHIVVRDLFRV